MCVLDISITLLYIFRYESIIRQKYNDRAKLLFTDKYSLCYCIETEQLEINRLEKIHKYDISNYPQVHKLYIEENEKKC